jgi:hypothetical protein
LAGGRESGQAPAGAYAAARAANPPTRPARAPRRPERRGTATTTTPKPPRERPRPCGAPVITRPGEFQAPAGAHLHGANAAKPRPAPRRRASPRGLRGARRPTPAATTAHPAARHTPAAVTAAPREFQTPAGLSGGREKTTPPPGVSCHRRPSPRRGVPLPGRREAPAGATVGPAERQLRRGRGTSKPPPGYRRAGSHLNDATRPSPGGAIAAMVPSAHGAATPRPITSSYIY